MARSRAAVAAVKTGIGDEPARARHLEKEAIQSIKDLVDALYGVDVLLKSCGRLLSDAQPIVNGRMVLQFAPRGQVVSGGERQFDMEPYMATLHNKGAPIRVITPKNLIGQRPKYVTDTGRRLPLYNDFELKRLLSEIESLLEYRRSLKELIGRLRMAAAPRLRGATNRLTESQDRLSSIAHSLKRKK